MLLLRNEAERSVMPPALPRASHCPSTPLNETGARGKRQPAPCALILHQEACFLSVAHRDFSAWTLVSAWHWRSIAGPSFGAVRARWGTPRWKMSEMRLPLADVGRQ